MHELKNYATIQSHTHPQHQEVPLLQPHERDVKGRRYVMCSMMMLLIQKTSNVACKNHVIAPFVRRLCDRKVLGT